MKKEIVSAVMLGSMVTVTALSAGGDLGGTVPVQLENVTVPVEEVVPVKPIKAIEEVVVVEEEVKEVKEEPKAEPPVVVASQGNYYVVLKGLSIAGDSLNEKDSDRGYGAGLDVGYRFGNGFAIELGTTYAKNQLENRAKTDMSYKTGSLDLVYDFELGEKLGIFAKGGYMYEKPSKGESENGLVYGGGVSYRIGKNQHLVGEYETSSMDSLRGDAFSLGLMIDF